MRFGAFLMAAAAFWSTAHAAPAAGLDAARALVAPLVEASVPPGDAAGTEELTSAFERAIARVAGDLAFVPAGRERARRLHELLHREYLHRYAADADGLGDLLRTGRYNCVSATLFYGVMARAAGLPARVIEGPRHLLLQIDFVDRPVFVEAVAQDGFDVDVAGFGRFALAYKYATPEELKQRGTAAVFAEFNSFAPPLELEAAVAFLWHNVAVRALESGRARDAAFAVGQEYQLRPDPPRARLDEMSLLLARAFSAAYEAGRFDEAWTIARVEVVILPDRVSPRDRFVAATIKRVQDACEGDDPVGALRELDFAEVAFDNARDLSALEREALPHIATAAVRVGAFDVARRVAKRYAAAERDPVEASRLATWVEQRAAAH